MDALIASEKAKTISKEIGFSEVDQTKIAIVTSELARNIIIHAMGKGRITISCLTDPKPGILIIAQDQGPGIPNAAEAIENSQSSKKGLGIGLGAVKRLMDQLTIETKLGEGTTITAMKWKITSDQAKQW